jgi:hypothetical protein
VDEPGLGKSEVFDSPGGARAGAPGAWSGASASIGRLTSSESAVRVALIVGAALSFTAGMSLPRGVPFAVLMLVALMVVAALVRAGWRDAGIIAIVVLLLAGLLLRYEAYGVGASDVLTVTVAAIERTLSGANPYGVGYVETDPPGAPFPYGPLSLLWYLPFRDDPRRFEFVISIVTLLVLAVRARPVGLAVYATLPPLLTVASDGANDTSAGLLLLAALVAMARVGPAGGVLLALAVAFKPFALAWVPAMIAAAGLANVIGFLVVSALIWVPILVVWGASSIATSLALAQQVHDRPYYSLAAALEGPLRRLPSAEFFDRLRYVLGGVAAIVTAPFVRTHAGLIASGMLVYCVTLYAGWWSTFAYLAAIAPVVCWYLDGWIGLDEGRVRWPGDPVGAFEAALDERWPLRRLRETRA